jgi:HSP20 family molecular chaperone IbpA
MYYQVQNPFPGPGNPLENLHLVPRVDILESTDEVVYVFEMPGIEEKSVHVEVKDGMLYVGGDIVLGLEKETLNIVYQERENIRRYNRFVSLPSEANTGQATANVKNGMLTIRFPKKIGRRLPVNHHQQQFSQQYTVQKSYNQVPDMQNVQSPQHDPYKQAHNQAQNQAQNMPPQGLQQG